MSCFNNTLRAKSVRASVKTSEETHAGAEATIALSFLTSKIVARDKQL
jgi:hypothetical protein